jgi:hypothetical protein
VKILPLHGVEIFTGTDGSNLHVHGCGFTFATATALTFEGGRHGKLNGGLRRRCGFKMTEIASAYSTGKGMVDTEKKLVVVEKRLIKKTGGSDNARGPARLSR